MWIELIVALCRRAAITGIRSCTGGWIRKDDEKKSTGHSRSTPLLTQTVNKLLLQYTGGVDCLALVLPLSTGLRRGFEGILRPSVDNQLVVMRLWSCLLLSLAVKLVYI